MFQIKFNKLDEAHPRIVNSAWGVIDFIFKHQSHIEGFFDCILITHSFETYEEVFWKWAEKYMKEGPEKSADLIDRLWRFLDKTHDKDDLGKKRGVIFECFLSKVAGRRYTGGGNYFNTGCQLEIENKKIVLGKKTVDFAGWDVRRRQGEFYEAKVNPNRYNQESVDFLTYLRTWLDHYESKYPDKPVRFLLGCLSMHDTDNLERRLKKLGADVNVLKPYGRDKLLELSQPQMSPHL